MREYYAVNHAQSEFRQCFAENAEQACDLFSKEFIMDEDHTGPRELYVQEEGNLIYLGIMKRKWVLETP